ncbi:ribosomal protein S11 [Citreicella sp. SE45]|nr:ribosomal protein S11 [Citreicella sp. SE45]
MARDTRRGGKKKVSKNIAAGVAHVNSSFNNTKILISDVQGNAISWSSAGTMGFKGSRNRPPTPLSWPPKTRAARRRTRRENAGSRSPGPRLGP